MNVMVMDVEGTDGRERGEDQVGTGVYSRPMLPTSMSLSAICLQHGSCVSMCFSKSTHRTERVPAAMRVHELLRLVHVTALPARIPFIRLPRAVFDAQLVLNIFIVGFRAEVRAVLSSII